MAILAPDTHLHPSRIVESRTNRYVKRLLPSRYRKSLPTMREIFHPDLENVTLPAVLHALSDPVRLQAVRSLAEQPNRACGEFDWPVSASTVSYHLKALREAGILRVCVDGKRRLLSLRREELDERFPGLLDAILEADKASTPEP